MSCELGHCWKVVRRDKLTTESGTMVIVFFRCKVCGFAYSSDEAELEEKDFEGAENYDREDKL
jgi:hypothetical protein